MELRREVERLCAEVQRYEAEAAAAGLGTHEPSGGSALEELSTEAERLRSLAERHEARATAALEEVSRLREELERERARLDEVPPPCPEPELIGKEAEEAESRLVELEQQLRELQVENSALSRQLSARPIVYQFAPLPEDAEQVQAGPSEEDDRGGEPQSGGTLLLAWAAAIWCRRRAAQGLTFCRRQRLAQWWEQSLRSFTRSLLQRPLLLWLFYTHVLVLWFLEFWRQAMSAPLEADPSNRLQKMVDKASKTP
mmetsp:Transcript_10034/g.23622  ORF Transcript_10034/g.23622 Transcript_10034/m.23622 type:complete len:255 (+) Transcript_10034:1-765(+)